jgi:hypothetical protein
MSLVIVHQMFYDVQNYVHCVLINGLNIDGLKPLTYTMQNEMARLWSEEIEVTFAFDDYRF